MPDKGSCSTICTFNVFTARCAKKYQWCFSLHLDYLSSPTCISEKINLGPCWRKDFWGLKVKHKITKCYFLWVDAINMQSFSGHYLMRQQAPMVFSLHLVLPQYCCLHFWKNKFGSMLAQGFLRVKSQVKITKCYFLWVGALNMQSLSGRYLMRQQVPMVFLLLLVYLGAIAYISVEGRASYIGSMNLADLWHFRRVNLVCHTISSLKFTLFWQIWYHLKEKLMDFSMI